MLLEFFDCELDERSSPVLLLYGNDLGETLAFRCAVKTLADGRETAFQVERLPGFRSIGGCLLLAQVGEANAGVERLTGGDLAFRCMRDREGWRHVWWLLEPFVDPQSAGKPSAFQYLDEPGAVEWIISGSRGW
jgi:hypothetical protein